MILILYYTERCIYMKFTKRNNRNFHSMMKRRNATWKKYKNQQNDLNADRRGVKNRIPY